MDDGDADETDALSRLEAALDRIAAGTPRPAPGITGGPDPAVIATRLDVLIDRLHRGLAGEG